MYIIAKVDKGLIINLETFVYSLKTAYMNIFFPENGKVRFGSFGGSL